MVRILKRLALVASCIALAGCAPPPGTQGPTAADPRLDPTERIVRLHVAVGELRDDPDAVGAAIELSRAETWVARAEALARTHTDPPLRDLLLDTAEGQITMVRSQVALRKSARALHDRDRTSGRSSGPSTEPSEDRPRTEPPPPSSATAPAPTPPAPNETP